MKLVWSPEKASKAYLDTVKSCESLQESNEAELISAMAAGWNAQMIVETWSRGGATSTSIGLSNAIHQTGGRHICIIPNEDSKTEYLSKILDKITGMLPEVVIGDTEQAMQTLTGIDFLVVDCEKNDFSTILRVAELGQRGAVLVCRNVSSRNVRDFRWRSVLDGLRIVRSVFLPIGKGLDIAHAAGAGEGKSGSGGKIGRKWIRRFDRESGEEYVIRK